MSEDEAIYWFTKNKEHIPVLPDGGVDFECLCGELLVEGVDYEVVKQHYDSLPPQLKRQSGITINTNPPKTSAVEMNQVEIFNDGSTSVVVSYYCSECGAPIIPFKIVRPIPYSGKKCFCPFTIVAAPEPGKWPISQEFCSAKCAGLWLSKHYENHT